VIVALAYLWRAGALDWAPSGRGRARMGRSGNG